MIAFEKNEIEREQTRFQTTINAENKQREEDY